MHKKIACFVIFICDIIAIISAFLFSGIVAKFISHDILGNPYPDLISADVTARLYSYLFMSFIAIFVFYNRGHYKRRIPWWSQVKYIATTLAIIFLIDGFIHFATKYDFSRLWVGLSWVTAFIFILLARHIAKIICCKCNVWKIPTTIIGDKENIIETSLALHSEGYTGYDLKNIIIHNGYNYFDIGELPAAYKNVKIIDGSKSYKTFLEKHKNAFFVIAPDSFQSMDIDTIADKISSNHSGYAVVPPVEGINLYGSTPQFFFGYDVMFLLSRSNIHSPFGAIIKRLMDVIGSIIGLILLSPVFIIVCATVKKDGGPAFFAHTRVGKNNKPFKCLKFRSMAIDAEERLNLLLQSDEKIRKEWEASYKLINDPRITKIGNFIRKTSIDELPQLINVLRGEMSLVGPRPIVEDEKKYYGDKIEEYLSVRPGVTGLWQASGRSETSYKQRVHLDSWYVNNWSIWTDIVVLIKTVIALTKRSGAY